MKDMNRDLKEKIEMVYRPNIEKIFSMTIIRKIIQFKITKITEPP